MFKFGKPKKQPAGVKELAKEVKELRENLEKTTKELTALKESHATSIAKVGLVRFNPFGEIGGDQSFCIALLNSEDTGVVITSHYGKDMQRVYAKPVSRGESAYSLSQEEQEAIKQAMKYEARSTKSETNSNDKNSKRLSI